MRSRNLLACVVTAVTLCACQVQANDAPAVRATGRPQAQPGTQVQPDAAAWNGRYLYEFDGGRNAADTGVVVTYTLVLAPSRCRLTAEGYQTDETIDCDARPSPAGLDILFKSYGDGRTVDARGNAVYQVGQKLFVLQRSGAQFLTDWRAYPLPDDAPHPKGVYFHR